MPTMTDPVLSPTLVSEESRGRGRKVSISREDIITAALSLIGPNRSVSTLSLREVAREAGVAPNSFYRHFRDMDELAIALIDLAGSSLRKIIGDARHRATSERSVVQSSVDAFMEQLDADDKLLHMLLREGTAGSEAFKQAVERQLSFFEDELQADLVRLAGSNQTGLRARLNRQSHDTTGICYRCYRHGLATRSARNRQKRTGHHASHDCGWHPDHGKQSYGPALRHPHTS